jgi:hypothetical protein
MATVEAAITFSAGASDGSTSGDLVATPMTIVLFEVREPLYIRVKDITGD